MRKHEASGISEQFLASASFDHVIALYNFDRQLRLLWLDALERIEVAVRSDIVNLLAPRGVWAHRDPGQFSRRFQKYGVGSKHKWVTHADWLKKVDELEAGSRDELFVKHYRRTYTPAFLPLWESREVWTFGTVKLALEGLRFVDLQRISRRYGLAPQEASCLNSWLRAFNYVRNLCAHHTRLWNRALNNPPDIRCSIPELAHLQHDLHAQSRVYAALAVTVLLMRVVSPGSTWAARLRALVHGFPAAPGVALRAMGFPPDWQTLPLWA